MSTLTRRRFLTITAAAGAGLLCGGATGGHAAWRGTALGADARMVFAGHTLAAAERAIAVCRAEVARLEAIFSLYDETSELSRLNRSGRLASPSGDLLDLMRLAKWFSERTGGAFDCTVQPLWKALAGHYARDGRNVPPAPEALREALNAVGHRRLHVTPEEIVLPPGGAVTLNGIAQGHITDRVAHLLLDLGWSDVLVDLGEVRALPGRAWPVRLAASRLGRSISDAAVATSAGSGTPLSAAGDWHHLIDPRSGECRNHFTSVSVIARRAVTADALSTALAVAEPFEVEGIAARFPEAEIWLQDPAGTVRRA